MDDYDDDMFLDEEDRRRLEEMTEKDREAEIFKRVEQREILRARFVTQTFSQFKLDHYKFNNDEVVVFVERCIDKLFINCDVIGVFR